MREKTVVINRIKYRSHSMKEKDLSTERNNRNLFIHSYEKNPPHFKSHLDWSIDTVPVEGERQG